MRTFNTEESSPRKNSKSPQRISSRSPRKENKQAFSILNGRLKPVKLTQPRQLHTIAAIDEEEEKEEMMSP